MKPVIIYGNPCDKWEEVQAIQHKPFVYVMSNGFMREDGGQMHIAALLNLINSRKLREDGFSVYQDNPCAALDNPDYMWNMGQEENRAAGRPRWINGDRFYKSEVTRFSGNFEYYSHCFCIDTNDPETISALKFAIDNNSRQA